MKRLLIVFTGGTIGSRSTGGEIQVNEAGSYALLDAYNASGLKREDVVMDTIQPLNILSENMTPNHWSQLAIALKEADWGAYAGIIVTHGSDTLAYTAAMFSYLFADIPIPLVFTASNYPLEDERSNGLGNFSHSIDYVMDGELPGVFVVYANDKNEPIVYLGTRITQCESFTDQFRCPYDTPYGKMTNRRFERMDSELNPSFEQLRSRENAGLVAWKPDSLVIDSGIVYVRPYPGLNYSYYRFGAGDERPKAILHDLHHSGTACAVDEEPYSLVRFIESCREQQIDVYLCPIKDSSDSMYSSSLKLIEAGAIMIEKLSVEAALTKLMLGWGLYGGDSGDGGRDSVRSFVTGASIYFERNEAYR